VIAVPEADTEGSSGRRKCPYDPYSVYVFTYVSKSTTLSCLNEVKYGCTLFFRSTTGSFWRHVFKRNFSNYTTYTTLLSGERIKLHFELKNDWFGWSMVQCTCWQLIEPTVQPTWAICWLIWVQWRIQGGSSGAAQNFFLKKPLFPV